MKFPEGITVFGDKDYRGDCPLEDADLITFFNQLRKKYPHLADVALHIKNEGKRNVRQVQRDRAKGALNSGASDIVIVGAPSFVCELKRKDHTKSTITADQVTFINNAKDHGAFVCIALGWEAALDAVGQYVVNNYFNDHGVL